MLNGIWLALLIAAVLLGGFSGRLESVTEGAVKSAELAVTLAIGLIGIMSLWLGLMRLAEQSGVVAVLARWLRPVLRKLFPDVPEDHPAMGSMVMNIAANMLGLTNAATPLGLRAMRDLEQLNPRPGTATNAMCTFLAINTGSVQLIPVTAIGILAAAGSINPTAIVGTALLATLCSSAAGLIAVKTLERMRLFRLAPAESDAAIERSERAAGPFGGAQARTDLRPIRPLGRVVLLGFSLCCIWFVVGSAFPELSGGAPGPGTTGRPAGVRVVQAISILAIPALAGFFPLFAALRGLRVYEVFVEGAKEGFDVAIRIIPYLVAMLVAVGMFRSAGGIELLSRAAGPLLEWLHFPVELLPMALMRPLSGSGSLGIFSELVQTYGPDSILVRMAGTLYGSTETTFYVIAVYFGAVNIRQTRHAVPAGLIADAAGIMASVAICRWIFSG